MGAARKGADALTARERRCIEAFLGPAKGDQTKAWRIASPQATCTDKTAREMASRVVAKPLVKAAIEQVLRGATVKAVAAEAAVAAKVTASAETVVAELARIGFGRITDVCEIVAGKLTVKDTADWPEDIKAAVAEISHGPNGLKVKMHP